MQPTANAKAGLPVAIVPRDFFVGGNTARVQQCQWPRSTISLGNGGDRHSVIHITIYYYIARLHALSSPLAGIIPLVLLPLIVFA